MNFGRNNPQMRGNGKKQLMGRVGAGLPNAGMPNVLNTRNAEQA